MPELPEVHIIASDLKKNLVDWRIDKVEIEHGYNTIPENKIYAQLLTGSLVNKVGRVGKNIVIKLSNGSFLTFHLAMTGRLLLQDNNSPKAPHQKVQLTLSNEDKIKLLRFCDARMFGKTGVLDAAGVHKLKQKYGPDVVLEEITTEVFLTRLRSKRTNIKNALLDQTIVAGLGNIYATDALWMARIHPEAKTQEILLKQAQALLKSAKEILLEGITHRGSTLPDEAYVDVFGKPGSHQNHFRIYGKTHCPDCQSKVQFKKLNGRGTYFCPNCQILTP